MNSLRSQVPNYIGAMRIQLKHVRVIILENGALETIGYYYIKVFSVRTKTNITRWTSFLNAINTTRMNRTVHKSVLFENRLTKYLHFRHVPCFWFTSFYKPVLVENTFIIIAFTHTTPRYYWQNKATKSFEIAYNCVMLCDLCIYKICRHKEPLKFYFMQV